MQPIQSTERPQLAARARLQTDKVTGKPILLYPEGVLVLNPTGRAIVELCAGQMSLQEIVQQLARRYAVAPEQIEPEVRKYLDRLRERNLLSILPPSDASQ